MIPRSVPWRRAIVYFTGVCEMAGAAGLLLPEFRRFAAYALMVLFLAVLPANIHAARAGLTLRGKPVAAYLYGNPLHRNSLLVRVLMGKPRVSRTAKARWLSSVF